MSSTSFLDDLANYAASRLAVGRIVWLWLTLSACVLIVSREILWVSAILGSLLAAMLIAQFRLWDDLTDRDFDAVLHPQRILVTTSHTRRFIYLCGLLTLPITALLGIGSGITHLAVYGALLIVMFVLYAAGGATLPRLLREHLVLLKYPVFIWLGAQDADPVRWAWVSAVAYLSLGLFELVSHPDLPRSVAWRRVMLIEIAALAAVVIILSTRIPS